MSLKITNDDQTNVSLKPVSITSYPLISQTNPTYNQFYFHNKILDQYSNLYKEFNNKNFNYYRIINKKLCLLYKLDHDDKESLEGKYKIISYFIKYE